MLNSIYLSSPTTAILLCITIMFLVGFIISRLARLIKLPDVTGYILAGIFLGPFVINLIPSGIISSMSFIADIALAFIAFGIGRFFKLEKDSKSRKKLFILTITESLITMSLTVILMYFVFNLPLAFCFLLGSIACATAPTSTMITVRQYKAKGQFINTLFKIIAIDNAIAIFVFHICLIFVENGSSVTVLQVLLPILYNFGLIAVAIFLGYILTKISSKIESKDNKLLLTLMFVFALTATSSLLSISPLLSCMALGISYVNFKGDNEVLDIVDKFSPPITLLFFVYAGMSLQVGAIGTIGIIGLAYFGIRVVGKIGGSFVGGKISNSSTRITKFVGMALIPQASISIGLATLATRVISGDLATILSVTILSSAVLYELIGPLSAKAAIFLSRSVPSKNRELRLKKKAQEDRLAIENEVAKYNLKHNTEDETKVNNTNSFHDGN